MLSSAPLLSGLQHAPDLQTRVLKLGMLLEKIQARDETLAAERHRYLELCTMSPDASLITNAKGRIREANPAARELLGASRGFISRRVLFTFIEIPDRRALRQLLAVAVLDGKDEQRHCDAHVLSRDSRRFPARVFLYASRPAKAEERGFYWHIRPIPLIEEAA